MFKELSKEFGSIKKIQSETKDLLIEIKDNLQGNNSRVDETENEINEHKEAKNKQSEQQEEKRIKKNENSISSL